MGIWEIITDWFRQPNNLYLSPLHPLSNKLVDEKQFQTELHQLIDEYLNDFAKRKISIYPWLKKKWYIGKWKVINVYIPKHQKPQVLLNSFEWKKIKRKHPEFNGVHVFRHIPKLHDGFWCPYCIEVFNSFDELVKHFHQHHKDTTSFPLGTDWFDSEDESLNLGGIVTAKHIKQFLQSIYGDIEVDVKLIHRYIFHWQEAIEDGTFPHIRQN